MLLGSQLLQNMLTLLLVMMQMFGTARVTDAVAAVVVCSLAVAPTYAHWDGLVGEDDDVNFAELVLVSLYFASWLGVGAVALGCMVDGRVRSDST